MAPCTYPGTSREEIETRRPHTCSRLCAFEEKKTKKKNTKISAPPKSHYEIHSNPATATISRRRATKHVPRVSQYSPAAIDLCENRPRTGLAISKKRRMLHIHTLTDTQTDRRTDRQIKCWHPVRTPVLVERAMRQGGLILAAGRVRSKKNKSQKKTKQSAPPKTHHEIHSNPATATTSRRRATKHVPRVCPHSPAPIDSG